MDTNQSMSTILNHTEIMQVDVGHQIYGLYDIMFYISTIYYFFRNSHEIFLLLLLLSL